MFNRIYIDVDGVLADFVSALLNNYNRKHGTSHTPDDALDWRLTNIFKEGQHWWEYTETPKFWSSLDVYPWAHELVRQVRATGRPYAFLTALTDSAASSRRSWLDKHFTEDPEDLPSKRMIIAYRKELVVAPGDLLIDDCPKNVTAILNTPGATVFPLAQPWNQSMEGVERMTPEQILTAIRNV